MIALTKQQEFDLLFKYSNLGFTNENLHSEKKWAELIHHPSRIYVTHNKEFLLEFKDVLDIENLSGGIPNYFMNDFEFFDEISKYIDFGCFPIRIQDYSTDNVSVAALRRYKETLNWNRVYISTPSEAYTSVEFLEEFKDVLCWDNLDYSYISEETIELFKNKVSWKKVCMKTDLSEDFIRRNKRKIAWKTL